MRGSTAVGVYVANTTDPKALAPYFERLALIDIAFPAFTDGRGFSLARLLRREGFAGELRASGKLTPDQYLHAIGSGFDHDRDSRTSSRRITARPIGRRRARRAASPISAASRAAHPYSNAGERAWHEAVDRRNARAAPRARSISIIA